ncbi:acyl carrier protein [Rhizobium rhizogenes]|uniref:acyl carrier protein n=1 Tax=Rhizobium rhizogenes TaxID=359 RepID=UPI0015724029|nr:acyl carrier protein [Rhizobium rhizogenes]NTF98236.1 acyl carrier protein [Rhizobium rhizogenes]
MSDVAERVKKTIAGYLDIPTDDVSDRASFSDDLGLDSLAMMELVIAFEEEFSVEFDDRSVEATKTVADAIAAVSALCSPPE